jgi:hypothetical protein
MDDTPHSHFVSLSLLYWIEGFMPCMLVFYSGWREDEFCKYSLLIGGEENGTTDRHHWRCTLVLCFFFIKSSEIM